MFQACIMETPEMSRLFSMGVRRQIKYKYGLSQVKDYIKLMVHLTTKSFGQWHWVQLMVVSCCALNMKRLHTE